MQMDKLFNIHLRHCHCHFVLHKKGQNGYFGPVLWIQTTAKKTSHLLIWQITFCLEQSFFPPSPPAESELDVFYVCSNRHFSIFLKNENKCQHQKKGCWETCLLEGGFFTGWATGNRARDAKTNWTMRSHTMRYDMTQCKKGYIFFLQSIPSLALGLLPFK